MEYRGLCTEFLRPFLSSKQAQTVMTKWPLSMLISVSKIINSDFKTRNSLFYMDRKKHQCKNIQANA